MKHCTPDPEAQRDYSGGGYLTIYSCEYDDGKRARGNFIRMGDDGKVLFLLCESCLSQLNAQVLEPIVKDVLGNRLPDIVKKIVADHIAAVLSEERTSQA